MENKVSLLRLGMEKKVPNIPKFIRVVPFSVTMKRLGKATRKALKYLNTNI